MKLLIPHKFIFYLKNYVKKYNILIININFFFISLFIFTKVKKKLKIIIIVLYLNINTFYIILFMNLFSNTNLKQFEFIKYAAVNAGDEHVMAKIIFK